MEGQWEKKRGKRKRNRQKEKDRKERQRQLCYFGTVQGFGIRIGIFRDLEFKKF